MVYGLSKIGSLSSQLPTVHETYETDFDLTFWQKKIVEQFKFGSCLGLFSYI